MLEQLKKLAEAIRAMPQEEFIALVDSVDPPANPEQYALIEELIQKIGDKEQQESLSEEQDVVFFDTEQRNTPIDFVEIKFEPIPDNAHRIERVSTIIKPGDVFTGKRERYFHKANLSGDVYCRGDNSYRMVIEEVGESHIVYSSFALRDYDRIWEPLSKSKRSDIETLREEIRNGHLIREAKEI